MSARTLRITMLVLTVAGLGVASYLTYIHYAGINPVCTAGGSCLKVQTSVYSKLAGVPVALMGLIGYVADPGHAAGPRKRDDPLCDGGRDGGRFRLQRIPHVSRAVLDTRDLRVVRLQCGHPDHPDVPRDLAISARRWPAKRHLAVCAGRGARTGPARRRSALLNDRRSPSFRRRAFLMAAAHGPPGANALQAQAPRVP